MLKNEENMWMWQSSEYSKKKKKKLRFFNEISKNRIFFLVVVIFKFYNLKLGFFHKKLLKNEFIILQHSHG